MRKKFAVLLGILAIVLILGCGTAGSSSAPTKAEFIKQANAICAKSNEKIEAHFSSFAKERGSFKNALSFKALGEFVASIIPTLHSEAKSLRDLGVPSGEEKAVNTILGTFEEEIEKREHFRPRETPPSLGEVTKAHKLAAAYGLKECASS